jgi:hypothetical protein
MGPYFVEDMQVLPGAPTAVAISRMYQTVRPAHAGVAIYDDGVSRPRVTQDHTGSDIIQFSASAARLYGFNTESTEYGFRRLSIDELGVKELDVKTGLIHDFDWRVRTRRTPQSRGA